MKKKLRTVGYIGTLMMVIITLIQEPESLPLALAMGAFFVFAFTEFSIN